MHKLSPTYGIAVELANPQGQRITGQIVLHDTYQATGTIIGITAKALLNQLNIQTYHFHEHKDIEDLDSILNHTYMSRKPTAILTDSNFWGGY